MASDQYRELNEILAQRPELLNKLKAAWLDGARHGVRLYAIWSDGTQLVGVMRRPMTEAFEELKEDCELRFSV